MHAIPKLEVTVAHAILLCKLPCDCYARLCHHMYARLKVYGSFD